MIKDGRFKSGLTALRARGMNLVAVLPTELLAQSADPILVEIAMLYRRLILIGAGGKAFWSELGTARPTGNHPVDDLSRMGARRAAAAWRLSSWQILYPGPLAVPLQALGKAAGWHHDSPLGVGLHPDYGPWFAYRALIATDTELQLTPTRQSRAPCLSCATKPCLGACPALALSARAAIDLKRCGSHRLAEDSSCAHRCIARNVCPVGSAHRYTDEQMSHHYQASLRHLSGFGVAHT